MKQLLFVGIDNDRLQTTYVNDDGDTAVASAALSDHSKAFLAWLNAANSQQPVKGCEVYADSERVHVLYEDGSNSTITFTGDPAQYTASQKELLALRAGTLAEGEGLMA